MISDQPDLASSMQHVSRCLLLAGLLTAGCVAAQDDLEDFGPKPTGAPAAKARYETHLKAFKDNPDILVLPGLVADRKARTVEVLTECTGLEGGEVAEFLLVDQVSSHGYEALLWSFAKPGDVHRALEFIGLKPGTPVNPAVPRIWADGDRVKLTVRRDSGETFPIEQLILDTETEKTLPEEGFVFSGSIRVPSRDGKGASSYAADLYDPRSVASIYNEPAAVLDVPRRLSQGDAYGKQVVNPKKACEGGTLWEVVMSPAADRDRSRDRTLKLSVDNSAGTTGIVCRLTAEDNSVLSEASAITPVLEELLSLSREGGAPYIDLSFGETVPLESVRKTAVLMAVMEPMGLVRVKPPVTDQLYYRAFVPDRGWLKPEGRPAQPWELHLARKDGEVSGDMVWQEPVREADGRTLSFRRHAYYIPGADALQARLAADSRERQTAGRAALPAVLLVFASPDLTYAEMMEFIRPVLGTHGTVYVFVEAEVEDGSDT